MTEPPILDRFVANFGPLQPAELLLLTAYTRGKTATVAESRPAERVEGNAVRGSLLRFLIVSAGRKFDQNERGVSLTGAWIEGGLDLVGAEALHSIRCQHCVFEAPPDLTDARIRGSIGLVGSAVPGLLAKRLRVDGSFEAEKLNSDGEIDLTGARVGGGLRFSGAALRGLGRSALRADRILVEGGTFLDESFSAVGSVRFPGAQVWDLVCVGATLDGDGAPALLADSIRVTGSIFLGSKLRAIGTVRLLAAEIGHDLDCTSSEFLDPVAALSAARASIGGNVYFDRGFMARGAVSVEHATVGATVECSGGTVGSIAFDNAKIAGDVLLTSGFTAASTVTLNSTQIDGNLVCRVASFSPQHGLPSLYAHGLSVGRIFYFRDLLHPANGVYLESATVGGLADDESAWGNRLKLDGFVYRGLVENAPTSGSTRLRWLNRQDYGDADCSHASFKPQPWHQLKQSLSQMGHAEDARQIGIAFEDKLRHMDLIGASPDAWGRPQRWLNRTVSRAAHAAFGWLAGYGYRPTRLVLSLALVWVVCAGFYTFVASEQGVFGPVSFPDH